MPNSPKVSTESGEHLDVPMTYSSESAPSASSGLVSTVHLSATCMAAGPKNKFAVLKLGMKKDLILLKTRITLIGYVLLIQTLLKGSTNQVETGEVGLCDASIAQHSRDLSPLEQVSFGDFPDSPAAVPQSSQSTPSTSRTPISALQSSQSTPSTSRTPVSALQSSQSTP